MVNVVPLEDYLLGVPSESGLPQLEAQKAQAVAARTYAVANIGGYGKQGFDMVPTIWSQVYKGVSIETKMGTQAVNATRGIVATYNGKPINAPYTSTSGGPTEDSENNFDLSRTFAGWNARSKGIVTSSRFSSRRLPARQTPRRRQSRARSPHESARFEWFLSFDAADDRRMV